MVAGHGSANDWHQRDELLNHLAELGSLAESRQKSGLHSPHNSASARSRRGDEEIMMVIQSMLSFERESLALGIRPGCFAMHAVLVAT
mmetsp:Transcript_100083/g.254501  ORF Transcript_100083/g.254501 Transcript_100083/m.254501 type:complete len:88 (+) Transcript_100083:427-690(+)